jgi:hypothetical protein
LTGVRGRGGGGGGGGGLYSHDEVRVLSHRVFDVGLVVAL